MPSRVRRARRRSRRCRRRSASTRRSGRRRRSRAGRGRRRTAAAGRPAWSGRGAARCRTAARRPRPARPRRRSVRGVAFGWAKVAVSMTMPAIRRGRQRAVAGVERDAEPGGEERDHLAGRGGARVDPVGRAGGVVRGVVVDDDARQPREQVGVADADLADPLERAAVGDDEQVVRRGRVRVGPEALDAGDEVVQRRDRVRAHRRRPCRRAPRRGGRPRAWPRACRRRGSRG